MIHLFWILILLLWGPDPGSGAPAPSLVEADRLQAVFDTALARNRYAEAYAAARRQLEIRTAALGTEDAAVAAAVHNLATGAEWLGRDAEADSLYRAALALRRRTLGPDHPDIVESLIALAQFLGWTGREVEGDPIAREALAMARRLHGDEHERVARALNTVGYIVWNRGDLPTALDYYQSSLTMKRRLLGDDHPEVAESLLGMAIVQDQHGRLAEAEVSFREATRIRRRAFGNRHERVAEAVSLLGVLLHNQGRFAEAEEAHREALAIRKAVHGEQARDTGNSVENLAAALLEQGRLDEAAAGFARATAIFSRLKGRPAAPVKAGWVSFHRGEYAGAEAHWRTALGLYEDTASVLIHKTRNQNALRQYIGRALLEQHHFERAETLLTRSMNGIIEQLGEENGSVVQALKWLGVCRLRLGDLDGARDRLVRAAHIFERSRTRAGAGIERATFVDSPYDWLAAARLARGETLKAWEALQRARGVTLGDLLHAAGRARDPGRVAVSRERVQALLPPGAALIGWLDAGTHAEPRLWSWGFVLRPDGPVRWIRLATDPETETAARDALRASDSPALGPSRWTAAAARRLGRSRLDPLLPHLDGITTLVVVPSQSMTGIPVEALVDDSGSFFGDRFAVVYAPSPSQYARLREIPVPAAPGRPGLLVGDPLRDTAPTFAAARAVGPPVLRNALAGDRETLELLPRLAGSAREVQKIAGFFPRAVTFLGRDATASTLGRMAAADELRGFGVLHLATHALVDEGRPLRSALVMSKEASGAHGMIRVQEIVKHWKLEAELVTLSACETALGRSTSEGTFGFEHAFFLAGARNLLLCLWKVDDQATALLMERFYRNWLGNPDGPRPSKAWALQQAKRWLRSYRDATGERPYDHPYFWAAFVLVGEGGG